MFIDDMAIPSFFPAYGRTAVTTWLSQHQQTCLWSQLLFTLALCLAALIRIQQPRSGSYENDAIMISVSSTILNLIITVISTYKPIYRVALFAFGFVVTLLFALVIDIWPLWWKARLLHVHLSCVDYADENNVHWGSAPRKPDRRGFLYRQLLDIGLVVLVLSLWLILSVAEYRPKITNYFVGPKHTLSFLVFN